MSHLSGLVFKGSEFVDCGNHSDLSLVQDLTIEVWFYIDGDFNGACLVEKSYSGEFDLTFMDGRLHYFHGPDYRQATAVFEHVFEQKKWYHIALVRNHSQANVRLYINGELDNYQLNYTQYPNATQDRISIGSRGGQVYNTFRGIIDEVRLWNIARTQADIIRDKDTRISGIHAELVGYWHFAGKSGYDYSGNEHHATLYGDFSLNSTPVYGPQMSALYFDGTNAVDCGEGSRTALSLIEDLTVEAWVYMDGDFNGSCVIEKSYAGEFDITFINDRLHYFHGPDYQQATLVADPVFVQKKWYHIAVVRNHQQRQVQIFVDGKVASGILSYTQLPNKTTNKVMIGSRGNGYNMFRGAMDDVRIWSEARTLSDINQNRFKRIMHQPESLEAYWHFDGLKALDYSGNQRDAILNGRFLFPSPVLNQRSHLTFINHTPLPVDLGADLSLSIKSIT